jgi:hypothetical protein
MIAKQNLIAGIAGCSGSLAMAALLLSTIPAPGIAQTRQEWTDTNASNILEKYPTTRRLWHSILTPGYRNEEWVRDLWGTSSERRFVSLSGRTYVYGGLCKPRDCLDNNLAFLIALDRSRAVGLVKRAKSRWTGQGYAITPLSYTYLGKPTAQERALLRQEVDR